MFDLGMDEIAVIAVVALVVIGPKDLPAALRTAGKWVRKGRLLAGEFHRTVDDMMRQAELDDVKRQLEQVQHMNVQRQLEQTIDPTGEMQRSLTGIAAPEPAATPDPAAAPAPVTEPPPAPALPPSQDKSAP